MDRAYIIHVIERFKNGEIIIISDNKDRENEGDFVQLSECVTPESINFMITHGRGLVCQSITSEKARQLQLPLQATNNTSLYNTAFTVSVDAKHGTTTGISVFDRARTIQVFADDTSTADDLVIPGHIFPIIAHDDGLMARKGHTEASIALARLANRKPLAVICEILNEEGSAANRQELFELAEKFHLDVLHIEDLILYISGGVDEGN